jgi:hypothetical protein
MTSALSAQVSALQFALNTQVATLQDEINALIGGAGAVPPTPNTLVLRDGSGGAKAAYIDSGAAADLLVKRNGTTQLTIGATLLTAAVGVAAPTFSAATGIAAPYVDSGASVDLLFKRNGVVKVTVGATGIDFSSETLTTTGLALSLGPSPASIGLVRLANASAAGVVGGDGNGVPMVMRNFAGSADLRVLQCNNGDDFVFGSQDPRDIYVRCSRSVLLLGGGGTWTFDSSGNFIMPSTSGWGPAGIGFAAGATATLYQVDKASAGVGATFQISGQKGNGANPGGLVKISGGLSGNGTTIAGGITLDCGALTGASASAKTTIAPTGGLGGLTFYQADSTKFLIEAPSAQITIYQQSGTSGLTQIGQNGHAAAEFGWSNSHSAATVRLGTDGYLAFFSTSTPIARPAAVGKFTNNTGGASSNVLAAITAGAAYSQADMVAVKNAIASISDKLASYENVFSDAQSGLGLTA